MLRNILVKISSVTKSILVIKLLLLTLVAAFFVRVYRVNDLLGFYYDQGRDALVIWKLWHEGKPFLIGPITGLQGIYLGPFYYYLIAPFYLIGGGNPVWPAVFLAFLSTLAVLMLFILGCSMHSRTAGIFAATIGAFSYYIVIHSRWLSNPNPILLFSLLVLYSMWKVVRGGNRGWWIVICTFVGISLHFEAASAVFYLPSLLIFAIWQKKRLLQKETAIISVLILFLTFLPQLLFNFRHENILVNNFLKLFFKEKAFRGFTMIVLQERINFFWNTFTNKIYAGYFKYIGIFISLPLATLCVRRKNFKRGLLALFLIFLLTPVVSLTFFQGNFGNIYDYYMSGYYLPFILLFSIGMAEFWRTFLGKILVLVFFITFFQVNTPPLKNYLTAKIEDRPIAFEEQLKAVDWVFENAKAKNLGEFNVDVYVPPVIPYAYNYLFLWQGTRRCGNDLCGMVDRQVANFYTLFEEDPPHPERLQAWLERQDGIGEVQKEAKFGMISVQRRIRL